MLDFLKNILFPALTSIGAIAVGILLFIKQYRSGSTEIQKEVSDGYEKRTKQLEEDMARQHAEYEKMKADYDIKLSNHANEISRLSGVIEEKDRQNKLLTELVQGRNPETLVILNELKELMKKVIDSITLYHQGNNEKLDYQTKILEATQARDIKIDNL